MPTAQENQQAAEAKIVGLFGGEPDAPKVPDEPGPQVAAPATEPPAGDEPPEAEATGQEPTPTQPEEVEVEIEGDRYLIPRKIADRFIHHADYTRKTMDLAEMRRATAAEREVLLLDRAFAESTTEVRNEASMLDAQIAQYRRVDWEALDSEQLLKARARLDSLKERRAEIEATIKAERRKFDEKLQSITAEAQAAGLKYIEQHLPKFDQAAKQSLFSYGIAEGYTREEMGKLMDPRLVVTMWKASQWDALQASKPTTMKKATAAPTIRPGASQPKLSRVQQMNAAVRAAKTPDAKKRATEEFFAAKFGG